MEELLHEQEEHVIEEAPEPEEHVGEPQQPVYASQQNEANIRELRKAAQRAKEIERERDEYQRRLQELEAAKQEASLNPDDLVEWKHVQREINSLKKEIDAYKQQSNAYTAEARLKAKYPDIEQVVNEHTIDVLREQYPELAQSISANRDPYSQAAAAYQIIKQLNIAPDDATLLERARVQENLKKPRPVSSVAPQQGDTPLSKANAFAQGLTPELRQQLLKEMQEAKKRI